ncbi:MAG: hypothetical protein A2W31_02110 [Planctomycetes bacterium RBG_16_64_10]|nr:MAG: hypothetical protein A2W31_02110 [Planctomycetes bacterium RBG_16_64_10]
MIETISILSGQGRNGQREPFSRIDFRMGSIASIVGPTGSGKTTLINDIELFAHGDTPSGRSILINDFVTHDPRIALLSDLRVVMQNGCVSQVLSTSEDERRVSVHVNRLDDALSRLREKLRQGHRLTADALRDVA